MAELTIFERLKQDHEKHRAMLVEIADSAGEPEKRKKLLEAFRIEVSAHAAAEEQTLYAAMLADPELQEDGRHSVSEHKEIEDMILHLYEVKVDGAAWRKGFEELRTEYDHHITEEEEEMFPEAAERIAKKDEVMLAGVFDERKPAEIEKAEETDPVKKAKEEKED
jgi:hypothetical protein